jgi:hypothetical protein
MLSVSLILLVHSTLRSIRYWPLPRYISRHRSFAVTEPLLLSPSHTELRCRRRLGQTFLLFFVMIRHHDVLWCDDYDFFMIFIFRS